MSIELSRFPVIDVHAHPFSFTREPKDFAVFASSGYYPGPNQSKFARSKMHYVLMIDHLKRYYGMDEDTPDEEVEKERYRRYRNDPSGYFHAMLRDANIGVLCNEIGTPHTQPMFSKEENTYYRSIVPEENFCEIVRIERVFEVLQPKKLPFEEYVREFHRLLDEEIAKHHAVGLKTLVAYFTGLNVQDISDQEAKKAYEKYVLQEGSDFTAKKGVHDHLVCMGLDACIRHDFSMQIHVGFGPSSFVRLNEMNPLGLVDIIKSPRYLNRVKIVLLHSCDPFIKEAGYLTGQFESVYCDFSSICFLSVNCASMIRTLMERASIEKLVYGSDCVGFPETAWVSAVYGRKQLERVLNDLVEEEILTKHRAERFGEMMLYKNAFAIYPTLKERPQFTNFV